MIFKPLLKESELADLNWDKYQEVTGILSRINRSDMEGELEILPGVFSYYFGLTVRAKTLLDSSEKATDEIKSLIRSEQRKTGVKLTALAGEDLVNCDENVQALAIMSRDRKETYSLMKSLCDALSVKKDMLIQLSANQRQETKLYSST